ncbi:hypothetical protein CHCC20441_0283 [Bacillus licheniformis]|uniref:Uncharacterized protein n=1 Tax=Bacillus licheniformis TaxID=1402 RepID=A0A8B5YC88_BACLI|nr:hypothetical protein MUY_000522 [Bacillus licheniformis WX-02]KYC68846.1 hypothetical protein B4092_0459 [Bacillus licheniformis]KYC77392.1 hypothetical protein B4090_0609 [Bacillus licheniformis]KYC79575.1 hypothetical protein B4091_0541 [Bacillus licheniformis]KYC94237.1 hypothetical protein B4164_0586 [Bacillus licheniformis]
MNSWLNILANSFKVLIFCLNRRTWEHPHVLFIQDGTAAKFVS